MTVTKKVSAKNFILGTANCLMGVRLLCGVFIALWDSYHGVPFTSQPLTLHGFYKVALPLAILFLANAVCFLIPDTTTSEDII